MRKPIAMLITLVFLAVYIMAAVEIGARLTGAPGLAQLAFYIVAGVVWAFPLYPLMRWMNARPKA